MIVVLTLVFRSPPLSCWLLWFLRRNVDLKPVQLTNLISSFPSNFILLSPNGLTCHRSAFFLRITNKMYSLCSSLSLANVLEQIVLCCFIFCWRKVQAQSWPRIWLRLFWAIFSYNSRWVILWGPQSQPRIWAIINQLLLITVKCLQCTCSIKKGRLLASKSYVQDVYTAVSHVYASFKILRYYLSGAQCTLPKSALSSASSFYNPSRGLTSPEHIHCTVPLHSVWDWAGRCQRKWCSLSAGSRYWISPT